MPWMFSFYQKADQARRDDRPAGRSRIGCGFHPKKVRR